MAKCGIKEYDNLPSRVGVIDVDYMRFKLKELNEQVSRIKAKLDEAILENGG